MTFEFLLIFFIARYVRSIAHTKEVSPVWDDRLNIAMYAAMGLFVASVLGQHYQSAIEVVGQLALMGVIYILYKEPIFKPARSIVIAVAPYVIVAVFLKLVRAISSSFYSEYSSIFDNLELFAIIWGVGVWLVNNKQKKELEKAKKKAEEETENNKIVTAMKAQLEVQVAERTAELTKQKEELEQTLSELRATQKQLIHSEKMASLGELTAGIAHEIQNPLNFVNNFSDVNREMIAEMKEEMDKGNYEDAKLIADDIASNEEKIVFHGKRADAIVKGMLQHSRSSSGQKELTDINALCDEYLRLSYHGLRAKDKTFNAKFVTDFDNSLGKIQVVPQDLGRVILNLINNAFYAVTEKARDAATHQPFEPTVTVSTKKLESGAEIRVTDNGNGIPETVRSKIFQPFFTTKPTGQGTGLGLSLSFDIISKGHGGKISVETEEGKGTTFIIYLPM